MDNKYCNLLIATIEARLKSKDGKIYIVWQKDQAMSFLLLNLISILNPSSLTMKNLNPAEKINEH